MYACDTPVIGTAIHPGDLVADLRAKHPQPLPIARCLKAELRDGYDLRSELDAAIDGHWHTGRQLGFGPSTARWQADCMATTPTSRRLRRGQRAANERWMKTITPTPRAAHPRRRASPARAPATASSQCANGRTHRTAAAYGKNQARGHRSAALADQLLSRAAMGSYEATAAKYLRSRMCARGWRSHSRGRRLD